MMITFMRQTVSEILKLNKSCISNPKSEILNWTIDRPEHDVIHKLRIVLKELNETRSWPHRSRPPTIQQVQFKISDFGFEMREAQARQRAASREDSSDFTIFNRCVARSSGPALWPRRHCWRWRAC